MSRFLPLFVAAALAPVTAFAQSAPLPPLPPASDQAPAAAAPPASDTSPVSDAPLDEASWRSRFAEASAKLAAGKYAAAKLDFVALAAAAPTPALRDLAVRQAGMAADLSSGAPAPAPAPPRTPDPAATAPSAAELPPDSNEEPPPPPLRSARSRSLDELVFLYTNTLTLGLVTGVLVDAADKKSAGAAIPIGTFTVSAIGSAVIAVADGRLGFRYGVPQSISTGLYVGLEQGLFWSVWDASRTSVPTPDYLHTAGTIWGFTAFGAVAGGVWGGLFQVTPGEASWAGSLSVWPAIVLGSTSLATTASGTSSGSRNADFVKGERNFGLVGGITGLVGLGVGAFTGKLVQPSVARARYLDLGGFVGGMTGAVMCAAWRHCDEAGIFGGIAIGTALGFGGTLIGTQLGAKFLTDRADAHFLNKVTPTIQPVGGGATFGLSGSLE